jgi:hypothetical protein
MLKQTRPTRREDAIDTTRRLQAEFAMAERRAEGDAHEQAGAHRVSKARETPRRRKGSGRRGQRGDSHQHP